jgi:DnaJ family protein C protein 3
LALGVLLLVATAVADDVGTPDDAEADVEPERVLVAAVKMTLRRGAEGDTFEATASVFTGEDAALGAFRFGEEYSFQGVDELISLSSQLQEKLDRAEYITPEEITHCGKRVCSAGKLRKRAEENRKVDLYDAMGADILRALQRKGLEEQVKDRMRRELEMAFQGLTRQREREHDEALRLIEVERRRSEAEAAMEGARLRRVKDDEDWAAFEQGRAISETGGTDAAAGGEPAPKDERDLIAEVPLDLTKEVNGEKVKSKVVATLREGQHVADAAFHFCAAHDIKSHSEVTSITGLLRKAAGDDYAPPGDESSTADDLVDLGHSHADAGAFAQAGIYFARALDLDKATPDSLQRQPRESVEHDLNSVMHTAQKAAEIDTKFAAREYQAVLDSAEGSASENATVLLMVARCHQQLGDPGKALTAAAQVISKSAGYGTWSRGQPRMMAVTLGANAAMEIGSEKKALKFFQTVLKYDLDQAQVRKQLRELKRVLKLLKRAGEQLDKGYNNKAFEYIDECLSASRGLDVDSPIFRSSIQLKLCKVQSKLKRHEEALETCDEVVKTLTGNFSGIFVDPSEALLARAEVLIYDDDYDEAVDDLRLALDYLSGDAKKEAEVKLREAQQKKEEWNGGRKDQFYNEHRGFPDGKPPSRDNIKILGLPVNLNDSSSEIQCKWLKKQYKHMAKKWHPDKYKGNPKRGARKMREVNDAKELLAKEWGCKMRKTRH